MAEGNGGTGGAPGWDVKRAPPHARISSWKQPQGIRFGESEGAFAAFDARAGVRPAQPSARWAPDLLRTDEQIRRWRMQPAPSRDA